MTVDTDLHSAGILASVNPELRRCILPPKHTVSCLSKRASLREEQRYLLHTKDVSAS